ncbi:MAG TPA: mercury(II) reductase, partial [Actinobacteria bacterium]|nr:mercury(II) reductase [Actinomycetes bacterium]HEX21053.1 mercury(II) reductase [Actinomycetota bacterium]
MMDELKYDLVVIGGGAAAFAAALKANEFGAKVAMIEQGKLGGTCVNVGCVPTKYLLEAARKYYETKTDSFAGVTSHGAELDYQALIGQKNAIVKHEQQSKYSDVLEAYENIDLFRGQGKFVDANTVQVGDSRIKADKFIIATGSSAHAVPIPGLEKVEYLTNIEALDLNSLPKSLIIIGGRAVGLEFAQIFSRLGTKVTLLQRSARILPETEPEISAALAGYLSDEGIEILTKVKTQSIDNQGGNVVIKVLVDNKSREIKAEKLLMATGRKANSAALDLEKARVEVDDKGFIIVNEEMQTNVEHIFAAGDVIGNPMLETVAAKEGSIAGFNAMSIIKKKTMDYRAIPQAVFTDPSVASVGLTDAQVNKSGVACNCRTLSMENVPKAKIIQDT